MIAHQCTNMGVTKKNISPSGCARRPQARRGARPVDVGPRKTRPELMNWRGAHLDPLGSNVDFLSENGGVAFAISREIGAKYRY